MRPTHDFLWGCNGLRSRSSLHWLIDLIVLNLELVRSVSFFCGLRTFSLFSFLYLLERFVLKDMIACFFWCNFVGLSSGSLISGPTDEQWNSLAAYCHLLLLMLIIGLNLLVCNFNVFPLSLNCRLCMFSRSAVFGSFRGIDLVEWKYEFQSSSLIILEGGLYNLSGTLLAFERARFDMAERVALWSLNFLSFFSFFGFFFIIFLRFLENSCKLPSDLLTLFCIYLSPSLLYLLYTFVYALGWCFKENLTTSINLLFTDTFEDVEPKELTDTFS